MVSPRLASLVCCPDCRRPLEPGDGVLRCGGCARAFGRPEAGYLDLRPRDAFGEITKYVDEALHVDARHERVSPPLLSAGIRNDMLRAMLRPGPGDRIVDLGCGSGRVMLWNAALGAWTVGVDAAPYFAREALEQADLVLGDLRRLPFPDGAFTKAYALDVLEHLSPEALAAMLRETARVLEPGGVFFAYSHVRRNAPVAAGLRAINRLARRLERAGLIDMTQERLRKSDHLNPLADVPELKAVTGAAGLRLAAIRYYTPLVGGVVENILVRLAERALARRAARRRPGPGGPAAPPDRAAAARAARASAKARLARRGPVFRVLQLVTMAMKVDLWLFGRIESGPFFALFVKEAR